VLVRKKRLMNDEVIRVLTDFVATAQEFIRCADFLKGTLLAEKSRGSGRYLAFYSTDPEGLKSGL
jgi:hypothetical protein